MEMNAVFQSDYGGVAALKYGTLPRPSLGAGDVLITVHAASVNPVDFKHAIHMKGETFPIFGGYDIAGVVSAVGEGDVRALKVGDRVFGEVTGDVTVHKKTGSFAEYAVVSAKFLAMMHESASFEEMAAAPIAVDTAVQVNEMLELNNGQKIFISAGAGGVGCHAIQIAKNVYGPEVATTASEAKAGFVKELVADRVVDYKKEDAGKVLVGWADVVFAGYAESLMCKKIAKEGGKIISIVEFGNPEITTHSIRGSTALMDKISEYVATGKLKIIIDTFTLLPMASKPSSMLRAAALKRRLSSRFSRIDIFIYRHSWSP